MHFGKPVFLARRTCLPEIGGDAADYFDDFDPAAMKRVVEAGLARQRGAGPRRCHPRPRRAVRLGPRRGRLPGAVPAAARPAAGIIGAPCASIAASTCPARAGCALTIGNFDGVHRGHQAMLALLTSEARHRGLPSCVLTFEPHPRDHFARKAGRPELAPPRIATLRDKLAELQRCGIDHVVVARFDDRLAAMPPQDFIDGVLLRGLRARYVLVGDDFSFGARRAGNYAMLDAAGARQGFDVARMMSYEVHGLRVSSSAVRAALAAGDLAQVEALLGRPYSVSGHVLHGRKLGRELGFRTLNLRFAHARAATSGIFVVRVHGLADAPLPGGGQLRRAAHGGGQRARAAGGALPGLAGRPWAPTAATAAACAWTCCTSCATRSSTTRCRRCRPRSHATPRTRAAGSPHTPRRPDRARRGRRGRSCQDGKQDAADRIDGHAIPRARTGPQRWQAATRRQATRDRIIG